SMLELGGRPAVVKVGAEGLVIATVRGTTADEAVCYPSSTVRWMEAGTTTWVPVGVSVDASSYTAPQPGGDRVEIRVVDPEGLRQGFTLRLRFRNEYFCGLF